MPDIKLELFDKTEEEVDVDITINNSSVAALEQELINQARREAKYVRLASRASKQVAKLNLDLEICIATVIKTVCEEAEARKKPIPATAVSELRRTKVPLDPEYQAIKRALIDATENANLLNGLVTAWQSRGFRLQELLKLAERGLWQPVTYKDRFATADERIEQAGEALTLE
jgi:spore germination protein YaaH